MAFILPGLGQVYAHRLKRGVVFLTITTVVPVTLYLYFASPATETNLGILLFIPVPIIFSIYIIIDAYRCVQQYNRQNDLASTSSFLFRLIIVFGILAVFILPGPETFLTNYIRNNYVQAFRLPANSMAPTIVEGDRVLANKLIYRKESPKRGDLVVFKFPLDPTRTFVKRVVGLGGEEVEIKKGNIYVNGQQVKDVKIARFYYNNRGDFGQEGQPVKIPPDHLFVLGDNSRSSHDSRFWGFVAADQILGKIYKIYWPIERSGAVN